MTDAFFAALTGSLGLSPKDLAEIGGFNEKMARDMLRGQFPFFEDVKQALLDIEGHRDAFVKEIIADTQDGSGAIFIFTKNQELRQHFPDLPRHGKAAGGFVGPHRRAALIAQATLLDQGFDVELMFWPKSPDTLT